jgi:hypothetical protein
MALTPTQVIDIIVKGLDVPLFLWGGPGIGKSDVVRAAAAKMGVEVVEIRLSLMDPTDLRGLPMIIDDKVVWMPPAMLPTMENTLLFFDELNHAPPSIQSAAFQIILEGRIGEHYLPKGTKRIAAGNPNEAGMIAYELALPLTNRFIHLDMRSDHNSWLEWAALNNIHPKVVSFIRTKPDHLYVLPKPGESLGFPTPRSWVYVSEILYTDEMLDDLGEALIRGSIGGRVATSFLTYLRVLENCETPEFVLDNPSYITSDMDKSVLWYLLSSVAFIVTRDKIKEFENLLLAPNVPTELAGYIFGLTVNEYNKREMITGKLMDAFISKEEVKLATSL